MFLVRHGPDVIITSPPRARSRYLNATHHTQSFMCPLLYRRNQAKPKERGEKEKYSNRFSDSSDSQITPTNLTTINMSNILRTRAVPIAATAALGGFIWWQTAGGRSQPNSTAQSGTNTGMPVSETLRSIGSKEGTHARKDTSELDNDPKDTRIYSRSPSADSKRNPQKVRDEKVTGKTE